MCAPHLQVEFFNMLIGTSTRSAPPAVGSLLCQDDCNCHAHAPLLLGLMMPPRSWSHWLMLHELPLS